MHPGELIWNCGHLLKHGHLCALKSCCAVSESSLTAIALVMESQNTPGHKGVKNRLLYFFICKENISDEDFKNQVALLISSYMVSA